MGLAEQRAKNAKMAADLVRRGIFHGKRLTHPSANSGGDTMTWGNGSAKNQRRLAREKKRS